MKKRIVVIAEGNQQRVEELIHYLNKAVSEGNSQPELTVSLQTSDVVDEPPEGGFNADV